MTYPSILEFHEERMIFLLTFFARRCQILRNFMRRFRETNVVLRHGCGDEQGNVDRFNPPPLFKYTSEVGSEIAARTKQRLGRINASSAICEVECAV